MTTLNQVKILSLSIFFLLFSEARSRAQLSDTLSYLEEVSYELDIDFGECDEVLKMRFHNDTVFVLALTFYKDFVLETYSLKDMKSGSHFTRKYCENGSIVYEYSLVDSLVKWESYHCNGNLWCQGQWIPLKLSYYGSWKEFDEDGTIIVEGQYRSYSPDIVKSYDQTKVGSWRYYDSDGGGGLILIEEYNENGTLERSEAFDK